jgi:hypothetical protein
MNFTPVNAGIGGGIEPNDIIGMGGPMPQMLQRDSSINQIFTSVPLQQPED